jgi:hypothetical protein
MLKNGKYVNVTPSFDFTLYTGAGAPIEQIKNWGFEVFSGATDFTTLGTRVQTFRSLIANVGGTNWLTSADSTWTVGDGGTQTIRERTTPGVSRTLTVNTDNAASAKMGIIVVRLPNNYQMT